MYVGNKLGNFYNQAIVDAAEAAGAAVTVEERGDTQDNVKFTYTDPSKDNTEYGVINVDPFINTIYTNYETPGDDITKFFTDQDVLDFHPEFLHGEGIINRQNQLPEGADSAAGVLAREAEEASKVATNVQASLTGATNIISYRASSIGYSIDVSNKIAWTLFPTTGALPDVQIGPVVYSDASFETANQYTLYKKEPTSGNISNIKVRIAPANTDGTINLTGTNYAFNVEEVRYLRHVVPTFAGLSTTDQEYYTSLGYSGGTGFAAIGLKFSSVTIMNALFGVLNKSQIHTGVVQHNTLDDIAGNWKGVLSNLWPGKNVTTAQDLWFQVYLTAHSGKTLPSVDPVINGYSYNPAEHVLNVAISSKKVYGNDVSGGNTPQLKSGTAQANYTPVKSFALAKAYTDNTSGYADSATSTTLNVIVDGGKYVIDGVSQKSLDFVRGNKYVFQGNGTTTSHPFRLSITDTASTTTPYAGAINGVTDEWNASQKFTFLVPHDAPSTLYYYCNSHSGMGGQINITGAHPQAGYSLANYHDATDNSKVVINTNTGIITGTPKSANSAAPNDTLQNTKIILTSIYGNTGSFSLPTRIYNETTPFITNSSYPFYDTSFAAKNVDPSGEADISNTATAGSPAVYKYKPKEFQC